LTSAVAVSFTTTIFAYLPSILGQLTCPLSQWNMSVRLAGDLGHPTTTKAIPSRPAEAQSLGSALDALGDSSLVNLAKNHTSGKSIIITTTKYTITMSILLEIPRK
jgi:hypothetical protein